MLTFIFGLVLVAVMLTTIILNKTYSHVPSKELKRRARQHDPVARTLFQAVAYGASLYVLLWTLLVLSATASFLLFASIFPAWFAFVVIGLLVWFGFYWLPSSRVSSFSGRVTLTLTPAVVWLLRKTFPALRWMSNLVSGHYPMHVHTGLYEKADLIDLLEWQKHQEDSRIPAVAIDMAEQSLGFDDKKVSNVLVPQSQVQSVKADDAIGPVLMDQLHKSGHTRFPVMGNEDKVVGIVYLRDLMKARAGGTVQHAMKRDVHFVHEDFSLVQALQAFYKTKQHFFVAVNKQEEYVGIITLEDLIEQVMGKPELDEFESYEDAAAVANISFTQPEPEPAIVEPETEELPVNPEADNEAEAESEPETQTDQPDTQSE